MLKTRFTLKPNRNGIWYVVRFSLAVVHDSIGLFGRVVDIVTSLDVLFFVWINKCKSKCSFVCF